MLHIALDKLTQFSFAFQYQLYIYWRRRQTQMLQINTVLSGDGLKLVAMRGWPHLHRVSNGRQLYARDLTSRHEGLTTVRS
jgi:hypothetical protein